MQVKFEKREELAPQIWQYYFRPEWPLSYTPGQYVSLRLPDVTGDKRGSVRTLTLTSLPSDPTLSFAAKFAPSRLSPYKRSLQAMDETSVAHVGEALGDVVLPKSPYVPLVFIAGGLGIASFVSILRHLKQTGERRDIRLLYARKREVDNPFGALLDSFRFTERQDFVGENRLSAANILPHTALDSLVYLSGSERFVELRHELEANQVSHEQIIFDFFDGYAEL